MLLRQKSQLKTVPNVVKVRKYVFIVVVVIVVLVFVFFVVVETKIST